MPKVYDFDEKSFDSSELITILQLNDMHYDPYYEPGSSSDCIELLCCRNTSIVSFRFDEDDNSTYKTLISSQS